MELRDFAEMEAGLHPFENYMYGTEIPYAVRMPSSGGFRRCAVEKLQTKIGNCRSIRDAICMETRLYGKLCEVEKRATTLPSQLYGEVQGAILALLP